MRHSTRRSVTWDMYRRADVPMPKNPDWPTDAPRVAWHNGREIRGDAERPLTPEAIREIRHGYLANITFMDAQIGKVLDELDRQQLTDSTVIVFCSDHGFHLGEHTLWAKISNFKLDARVPLLIATPKMKSAGKTTDSLAELLDLYPTLVELCNLPKAPGLDGVSLVPVLASPLESVRPAALSQHPRPAYYKGAPETMGYDGNAEVKTPNIDRLAAEGIRFHRTYANVPVCCPARAILMTGTYPHVDGMVANDLRLREEQVTIAEILAAAGYRMGFIGKWHLDGICAIRRMMPVVLQLKFPLFF